MLIAIIIKIVNGVLPVIGIFIFEQLINDGSHSISTTCEASCLEKTTIYLKIAF